MSFIIEAPTAILPIFKFAAAVCAPETEFTFTPASALSAAGVVGLAAVLRAIDATVTPATVAYCADVITVADRLMFASLPPAAALAAAVPATTLESAVIYAVLAVAGTTAATMRTLPTLAPALAAVAGAAEAAAAAGVAPLEGLPKARPARNNNNNAAAGAAAGATTTATAEEIAARRAAKRNAKKAAAPAAPATPLAFDDFAKTNIQVCQIVSAEPLTGSDKLFDCRLRVAGEETPRRFVTGLQPYYAATDLVGRNVIAILNLKPATLAGVVSQAMVLCGSADTTCRLLTTDAPLGTRLAVTGVAMSEPAKELTSKAWSRIKAEFKTGAEGAAQLLGAAVVAGDKTVYEHGKTEGLTIS